MICDLAQAIAEFLQHVYLLLRGSVGAKLASPVVSIL